MKAFDNKLNYAATLKVKVSAPIDDRVVVKDYNNLIESDTFDDFIYKGLQVSTQDGQSYVYTGTNANGSQATNPSNWVKQLSANDVITSITNTVDNTKIVGAKAAKDYIDNKVSNAGSVFRYRGTVASAANLPQGTYKNEAVLVGDVFTALDTQVNYICYRIQGRKTISVAGSALETINANITKKINFASGLSGSDFGNAATTIQKLASAGTLKIEIGSATKTLPARLIDMSENQDYSKVAIACYDSSNSSIYVITGIKEGASDTCMSTKFESGVAITPAIYVTSDSAVSQYDYDSFGGVLSLQWN